MLRPMIARIEKASLRIFEYHQHGFPVMSPWVSEQTVMRLDLRAARMPLSARKRMGDTLDAPITKC